MSLSATPAALARRGFRINQDGVRRSVLDLLAYPDVTLARLAEVWPELKALEDDVAEQLEIKGLYAGYMTRQESDMRSFRKDEALKLPMDLNYGAIGGLSNEIVQKLQAAKPSTLGAAARISGVTPAALTSLLAYVKRSRQRAA